jgi:hypothetical protein
MAATGQITSVPHGKSEQGKFKNLVGRKFGRLTVIERAINDTTNRARFLCHCLCGNVAIVRSTHLISGTTNSCGCYMRDKTREISLSHGHKVGYKATKEYQAWASMKSRITNPRNSQYNNYGGRGITICARWYVFENFICDMGKCPDHYSLERIDVNGNYNKNNCIWASQGQQQNNRRNNKRVEYCGQFLTMAQLSKQSGIPYNCLRHRLLDRAWTVEEAVTTPRRDNGYRAA